MGHAANVATTAAGLRAAPKSDPSCAAAREELLEKNRRTKEGRAENTRAGCIDGGVNPNPNPETYDTRVTSGMMKP